MSSSTGVFLLGAMTGATVISLGTWAVMNRTLVKLMNAPTYLPVLEGEEIEEETLPEDAFDTCGYMFDEDEDDRAANTAHRTVGK